MIRIIGVLVLFITAIPNIKWALGRLGVRCGDNHVMHTMRLGNARFKASDPEGFIGLAEVNASAQVDLVFGRNHHWHNNWIDTQFFFFFAGSKSYKK